MARTSADLKASDSAQQQMATSPTSAGVAEMAEEVVLAVKNLTVEFETEDGVLRAVEQVSWELLQGETLGLVGESGSGKSVSVLAVLGLIKQPPGRIVSGEIWYDGSDLLAATHGDLRAIRGTDIAMIFQDPTTSLNPVVTVGSQISEAMLIHDKGLSKKDARDRAIALLASVGVPSPEDRVHQYPHEFSGGMKQRAMIAMAIANKPRVLIADEPTTSLDVTIQAQFLDVLRAAQRETGASTIFITHDLGVIAEMADRVVVMYGGRVVETADVETIFKSPSHPYTLGLMNSVPKLELEVHELAAIPGQPPDPFNLPPGCTFQPRCELGQGRSRCTEEVPELRELGSRRWSACHFAEELEPGFMARPAEGLEIITDASPGETP